VATVNFHPDLQQLPSGTVVKLFAVATPRQGELSTYIRYANGNPETWNGPKLGTPIASPTVAAGGELPVAIGTGAGELAAGKPGLVAAEVSGTWRYLFLRSGETAHEPV